MTRKGRTITTRVALFLFLPALVIAGCEKQKNATHEKAGQATTQEGTGEATNQEGRMGGGRQRLRAVCADDIQKYCASADKKRRCLKENIDKLSDACKTAVEQRHGRKARDNDSGDD